MENNKTKKKQKDIITIERNVEIKPEDKVNENTTVTEENVNTNKVSNNISDSTDNNSVITKVLYKLQLLLSMTNKLDEKILQLLSQLLSEEHLRNILEERDCRGICGNLLCGLKLNLNEDKHKYSYNNNFKLFTKENAFDYFCDVKCFQKFKDLLNQAKKFDYLRLLNMQNIYTLAILKEFYPTNKYLEEISTLAFTMLNKELRFTSNQEHYQQIRGKYIKYFSDEIIVEVVTEENSNEINLNKIFN